MRTLRLVTAALVALALILSPGPIAPPQASGFSQGTPEGTWTPVIKGDGVAGANTYSVQVGRYVQIGNLVCVFGRLTLSAKDGAMTGNVEIGGLPFTSRSLANLGPGLAISVMSGVDLSAGYSMLSVFVNSNTTDALLMQGGDNVANATLPVAQISATGSIGFSGCYLI